MISQPLCDTQSFNAGADLWVLSGVSTSKALKKIDWFLNFLFFNSEFKNKQQPTLVSAYGKLPTQCIVSVPFNGNINDWTHKVQKICNELGSPTLRLFLPQSFNNPNAFNFPYKNSLDVIVE